MSTQQEDVIELPGDLGTGEGCESFQLAIDIAAAGALDAVARAQLERHLGHCETCRDYRERSADVSALVATSVPESNLTPARWHEIETRLKRLGSGPRVWIMYTARAVVFSLAFAFLLSVLNGQPMLDVRFWIIATLGLVVMCGSMNAFSYRRLRRALAQHDVLSVHRRSLTGLVKVWPRVRWMGAISVLFPVLMSIQQCNVFTLAMIALQLVGLGVTYHRVRAARRELAVLS